MPAMPMSPARTRSPRSTSPLAGYRYSSGIPATQLAARGPPRPAGVLLQDPASIVSDGYYLYYLMCGDIWRTSLARGSTSEVAAGQFQAITVGPGGTLFVTGNGDANGAVFKVDPTTGAVTTFFNFGFESPRAIAADAQYLWVRVSPTYGPTPLLVRISLSDGTAVSYPVSGDAYDDVLTSAGAYRTSAPTT